MKDKRNVKARHWNVPLVSMIEEIELWGLKKSA